LSPTDTSLSPFNISNTIQSPYFTIEETRKLFRMFMQDNDIVIEDAVIQDVWAQSNGYITQLNSLPSSSLYFLQPSRHGFPLWTCHLTQIWLTGGARLTHFAIFQLAKHPH
jgi:hypothetical protein